MRIECIIQANIILIIASKCIYSGPISVRRILKNIEEQIYDELDKDSAEKLNQIIELSDKPLSDIARKIVDDIVNKALENNKGSQILKEIISGYRVSQWKPTDLVNPEELGEYFEGDIVGDVTRKQDYGGNGRLGERYRWPGGVVPYVIHKGFSSHDLDQLATARDVYETKTEGCIRWVERTDEKDYVNFTAEDTGCHSSVGRVGYGQTVNLHSPGCLTRIGTVEHEMLHALGFRHMHNTYDRDEFVEIMKDNIMSGKEHNFKKYSDREVTDFGVSYDYGSVMHYSRDTWSKNGKDTIIPYDEDAEIGQRDGLSDKDLAKLLLMYNCPAYPKYKHLLE